MTFTPLHSAVSVLKDIHDKLKESIDGDDLDPEDITNMLDEIDQVFDIDEVKSVLEEFRVAAGRDKF